MKRRLARFAKQASGDLAVSLLCVLLGSLSTYSVLMSPRLYFFNYRSTSFVGGIVLYVGVSLCVYALVVYTVACVLRQFYSQRKSTFEPALLVAGGLVGGVLGYVAEIAIHPTSSVTLVGIGLGLLPGTWLACSIKFSNVTGRSGALMRASIPIGLIVCLYLLHYSGFPGENASAQARHKWGVRTFGSYDNITAQLNDCKGISDKIGDVTFVAPTVGENFYSADIDSYRSGTGEFTLEVVGTTGTGIVQFPVDGNSVAFDKLSFSYRGKKEENLLCQ